MTGKNKKIALMISLFLFTVLVFFKIDPLSPGVDKRIYTYYTISLIENFNLNVVSFIPAKDTWLLTKTFNYPDIHSNGVAVLWAPFFYVAKQIARLAGTNIDLIYKVAQTTASTFFGLLSISLLWSLLRRSFSKRISFHTLILLLVCSPFLWFLLFFPENVDITSLFVWTALLNLYSLRNKIGENRFPFIFGLALFASFAVKCDAIFYGLLFLHYLIERKENSWNKRFRDLAGFSFGSVIMLIPTLSNEVIKDGFFDYTYFDTVTGKVFVLYETLFSPSGYFVTHPFYALLFLGFVVLACTKRVKTEYWFYLAIPAVELLLSSFNYIHNDEYAPRHWINDSACIALLLAYTLEFLEDRPKMRFLFIAGCIVSSIVSVISGLASAVDIDTFVFKGNWSTILERAHLSQFSFLYNFSLFSIKLVLLPLILASVSLLFYLSKIILKESGARLLIGFFCFFSIFYWLLAASNYFTNATSAALSKDRIEKAVVGNGPYINSFFENVLSLEHAIEYYKQRGDLATLQDRREVLNNYIEQAASEITVDPIGFRASLVPNKDRYLNPDLTSD
jgi:hypothetical protein